MNKLIQFSLISLLFFITKNTLAQQKLLWSDVFQQKISIADIDGTNQEVLLSANTAQYHDINFSNSKIYWSSHGVEAIYVSDLNGSNQQILTSLSATPQGISISDANEIYIVVGNSIKKFDSNGMFIVDIHTGLDAPAGLVVYDGKIYWGNNGTSEIEKSNLDGTSREVILNDAYFPIDLKVNKVTNELYWIQSVGAIPGAGIFKSNLDGSNRSVVIEEFVQGIAIDDVNNYLYWSESIYNTIHRTNLNDLSDEIELIDEYLVFPKSIVLDTANNEIIFINLEYGNYLYRANLDNGEDLTVLASAAIYNPKRFEVDTLNEKIYWVNSPSSFADDNTAAIMRANLDGTNIEKLVDYPVTENPFGLALDVANNKLYWTDTGDDAIFQADLDGGNVSKIIDNGLSAPVGITIDFQNSKLYWCDWSTKKIQRADLDGSNVEDIIDAGLGAPWGIKISPSLEKFYWTDKGNGTINRADLDGSNMEVVLTTNDPVFNHPNGLHLDEANQKLYYSIDFYEESIHRANYDGTEMETLISGLSAANGVAVINYEAPLPLTLTSSSTDVLCNGDATGSISLIVDGGISPFTYTWSDNSLSGASLTSLPSGNYEVTITDSLSETISETFIIQEPTALEGTTLSTSEVDTNGNGSAVVSITGGVSPYTYLWNDSNNQTTPEAINLSAGDYNVVVTDANGCIFQEIVTVDMITDISNIAEEKIVIQISPNPVMDYFNLEISGMGDNILLTILSIEGKLMREQNLVKDLPQTIYVSSMDAGFYFIKLQGENGNIFLEKIMIGK